MPSDLKVKVAAAHTTETGEPRVAVTEFQLPMCIVCRLVPPLKSNTFKVRRGHRDRDMDRVGREGTQIETVC
jgi:hypothetical protein